LIGDGLDAQLDPSHGIRARAPHPWRQQCPFRRAAALDLLERRSLLALDHSEPVGGSIARLAGVMALEGPGRAGSTSFFPLT
jgi:hypothetical protein